MRFPKVSPNSMRAMAIEIRNEMSGGLATDDSKFSIRHIESEIRHVQAQVQYEMDKQNEAVGLMPSDKRLRIFACKDLSDTQDFFCKCTAGNSGGKFKKVVLPELYQWKNRHFISYFGNTDMDLNFTPVSNIAQMNILPTINKRPAFFMIGNIAYVSLPLKFALMCKVTVLGIPADPNETDGKCFDPWSVDWNVDREMVSVIKSRVRRNLSEILLPTSQNPDIRNNANDGNQVTSILAQ